jgi:hypothetical protein
MGVEYKHFLVPANPSFVPERGVIQKVDDVLRKWNLRTDVPKVYDLTRGIKKLIFDPLDSITFGQGLAIEYPDIDGIAATKVMGESYYDGITDEDRYIQQITFIVGLDFRIHPSSEELTATVKAPPLEKGVPSEPYTERDELLHYRLHAEAYHSSVATSPPQVNVWVADKNRILGGRAFPGFWRMALIIDCGKDLPALGDDFYIIPEREFVNELEVAWGSQIVEVGEVY